MQTKNAAKSLTIQGVGASWMVVWLSNADVVRVLWDAAFALEQPVFTDDQWLRFLQSVLITGTLAVTAYGRWRHRDLTINPGA